MLVPVVLMKTHGMWSIHSTIQYIHLALTENIAKGHYSINLIEYSSLLCVSKV